MAGKLSWPRALAVLVLAITVAAGMSTPMMTASAASAPETPTRVVSAVPRPATSVSAAPCVLVNGPANCQSTDPFVTIDLASTQNASVCTWSVKVNWDDGTIDTIELTGPDDGTELLDTHTYKGPGVYSVTTSGMNVSGPANCELISNSYQFTLASAATPAGEACVVNAPTFANFLAGHVAWGFKLADGTWEFGANEGEGRKDGVSKTWYATGSQQVMLATFLKGGPYQKPGYYVSVECVTVPAPKAAAAKQQVRHEQGEQYHLITQDCESQAYNVLSKYGVSGLPGDIRNPTPNTWYEELRPSAGFGPPKPL
jgi:hypothetical protein